MLPPAFRNRGRLRAGRPPYIYNPIRLIAIFAKNCAERQGPKAWRSRRERVRAGLRVDPARGHGAIQTGEHLFYEREGANGVEKLAGRARFAPLWGAWADGQWRLSRVFSYAHGPAE